MNNKEIKISMSYITNFKPANFSNFKDFNLFKNNKNKKIISRNFFLFLLLLKYTGNKNLLNVSLFVKPFYKKFITVLRAPYRHKLSRHQFVLSRYSILYTLKISSKNIFISNIFEIIYLIKKIKKFYIWFESNIVYQHQTKIFINFFFEKNFNILNFAKI